jgi:uncharacterized protein (TIGR02246 family)
MSTVGNGAQQFANMITPRFGQWGTRMRLLVAAMAFAMASLAQAEPKDDAYKILGRWADAFNAGKPDEVMGLYTADATVWGTLSPTLTSSPAAIESYFAGASAIGAKVRLLDHTASELSDGVVVETGRYDFERIQNGQTVTLPARYSFVLVKQEDTWKIAHHHSSPMPKTAP